MQVLKSYPSPRGWAVIPVHYSHDPDKDAAWADAARKKFDTDDKWATEMEIDFQVHVGALAYPNFKRAIHVFDELPYYDRLPLTLFCDFNQSPLAWGIGQVVQGVPCVLDEIFREPSTIEAAVEEFRNSYPAHKGELLIYGDATTKSFYDTMKLALRGYSAPLSLRVSAANPKVKDRVNAVNVRLKGVDGNPGVKIAARCKQLIQDLEEVMWRPNEKDLLKVTDQKDPYYKRTHISDAMGYWVAREWPVISESAKLTNVKRAPMPQGKVLGDLYFKGHMRGQKTPV